MGYWMRFAAPDLWTAMRTSAAAERAGQSGEALARSSAAQRQPPFLVTMGAPALSRSVKALAFVFSDLQQASEDPLRGPSDEERFAGAPSFCIVPRFWQREAEDAKTGKPKIKRMVVLCLRPAASPSNT